MANIIGKNIKTLRENMGFTQASIANFLKIDQSMISKVEKGERTLSIDMLEKLSCLFGVTVEAMEKEIISESNLSVAFRADELSTNDMETISAINRIAMNVTFLTELLKKEESNND